MKLSAVASPTTLTASYGREFISLSPKLASANYSEEFAAHFNSPKTFNAKGFVLQKSNNQNVAQLVQTPKSTLGQAKSKAVKSIALTVGTSTPNQKAASTTSINSQSSGAKDEKKSSSLRGKGESLRTMSSTPKSLSAKASESLRLRDNSTYSSTHYVGKWKKLEITTEFNSKTSYASRAQTTKNTEVDENVTKEQQQTLKTSVTQQSLQPKKTNSLNGSTVTNQQNGVEQRARARPLSSSDANPKISASSSPKNVTNRGYQAQAALVKENIRIGSSLDKEANATRSSFKKDKATNSTPKKSQGLLSVDSNISPPVTLSVKKAQVDLRSSWQGNAESTKKRPSSVKKMSRDTKEEQNVERNNSSKEVKAPTQKVSLQGLVTQITKG